MQQTPNPRLFKLERSGSFDCDSYCWTAGPKTLYYQVEIKTKTLDREGFVFDNRKIEDFFTREFGGKKLDVSCEVIAHRALEYFCSQLPECEGVVVKVSGNPSATWLCCSFDKEEEEIERALVAHGS